MAERRSDGQGRHARPEDPDRADPVPPARSRPSPRPRRPAPDAPDPSEAGTDPRLETTRPVRPVAPSREPKPSGLVDDGSAPPVRTRSGRPFPRAYLNRRETGWALREGPDVFGGPLFALPAERTPHARDTPLPPTDEVLDPVPPEHLRQDAETVEADELDDYGVGDHGVEDYGVEDYDDDDDYDDDLDGIDGEDTVLWSADGGLAAEPDPAPAAPAPAASPPAASPPAASPRGPVAIDPAALDGVTAPMPRVPRPSRRVKVVLAERRGGAHPVRTVVDIQDGGGAGQMLRTDLLRAQANLAGVFTAVVVATLGLLPLLFAVFPELGTFEIGGIRLPWLLLGLLAYPLLMLLGWLFVRASEKAEQEFADQVQD